MEALPFSAKLTSSSSSIHNYRILSLSSFPTFTTFKPTSRPNSNSNSNSSLQISHNLRHSLPIIRRCSSPSTELATQPANSSENNQNTFEVQRNSRNGSTLLFPDGFKRWLVNVNGPPNGFSSKPQAVDFYVDILTKVLGNEKDAQMCLYHVSWTPNFGFCCMLDQKSAQELAAVPGVLSVQPAEQFESEAKEYGGSGLLSNAPGSAQNEEISKTKLFITGLSFYTSEKTLRAAFEPFGELVEVKVIMDKISKRSKGYAFVEYATEEAATTALQEMNGKIIDGWMIVVDRAKSKPRLRRGRPKSMSSQNRKLM